MKAKREHFEWRKDLDFSFLPNKSFWLFYRYGNMFMKNWNGGRQNRMLAFFD